LLVKHTLSLKTGEVLKREVIDENAQADTRILVDTYARKVDEMKKGGSNVQ
jgi:archaellum component FlaG (FlaF/FlaG flagellin family)